MFVCVCAVWALVVEDPLGGEPIAVVATGFDAPKTSPAIVWRHRDARPAQL